MAEQDRLAKLAPGQENVNKVKDVASNAAARTAASVAAATSDGTSEQDRYGHYFGLEHDHVQRAKQALFGSGSTGAEQDRWSSHFSLGTDGIERAKRLAGTKGVGAEQDRYGSHFRSPSDPVGKTREAFQNASGSEQDRYGQYFKGSDEVAGKAKDAAHEAAYRAKATAYEAAQRAKETARNAANQAQDTAHDAARKVNDTFRGTAGGEQDRFGNHFRGVEDPVDKTRSAFRGTSGAEQDRYSSHFEAAGEKLSEKARQGIDSFKDGQYSRRAELNRSGTLHPSKSSIHPLRTSTVGILELTILPSLGLHTSLAGIAYGVARYTNRVDVKDYLWPSAQVVNVWWSAIGRHLADGVSFSTVWESISYSEKLLLGGVTAWGLRLFYRVVTRSTARGTDDPRYVEAKKEEGFWNKAAYSMFFPEALIQTLISLPFTLPFRDQSASAALAPVPASSELAHMAAVFLFSCGFALEVLADQQLATHTENNSKDLNREGVWSIVRHPNYLGDTLIHASFPILLYGCGLLHPLALLGPAANYVFLRFVGGDAENEASQEERYRTKEPAKYTQLQSYKKEKNSFWPRVEEFSNSWFLTVVGVGAATVFVEKAARQVILK